ncbi:MAG TPA: DUF4239 domain-containing protein [Rudaea sp.]|nr:DUF4239 domain-containing protein [Rudaea sp.]
MSDWLLNLPVPWMAALILAAIYAVTAAIHWSIMALAVGERARAFKAISPGMLPPLSVIFALLVAFLASQVWSEAERASSAVNREASALRATVLLAGAFPGEPETHLRDLVRSYIQEAVSQEWPAMARQGATLTIAPAPLAEALALTLALSPHGDGQTVAQREMTAALQTALEARRQRIILSRSSINWVKWSALLLLGGLTLVTIAMVHSDNRAANGIILAIFSSAIGVAVLLLAAHTRPFTGEISVSPGVLLQVMPEGEPAPPPKAP